MLKENIDLVVLYVQSRAGGTNYINGSVTRKSLEYGTKMILVIQAVPFSRACPTAVEKAVEKYGRR